MSQASIRAVLLQHPHGLSIRSIQIKTGLRDTSVCKALPGMPDVYIVGWVAARAGPKPNVPVYAAVVVPADCPMPT